MPTPRDTSCQHPVADGRPTRRDGHREHWTCGLCGAHLTTDHATGHTTQEVTGR